MRKLIGFVTVLLLGLTLSGCETTKTKVDNKDEATPQPELMRAVKGTLFYRERIALVPNAEVQITLEDVSLADAPSKIMAKQVFTSDGDQVPLDFELSYDKNQIQPNHRYSVRAQIRIDGKLRFTTDTAYPVITDKAETENVQLLLKAVR